MTVTLSEVEAPLLESTTDLGLLYHLPLPEYAQQEASKRFFKEK
jgi:hypothetical protein